MAETIGSLIDKISIFELKIYHMEEQVHRDDASPQHRDLCKQRLEILKQQRDDLVEELSELYADVKKGKIKIKIYRQFKMYNDPSYKIKNQ